MNQKNIKNDNSIIRLVIIEDNKFTRSGWEAVIQSHNRFSLIGSFADCESAFASNIWEKVDLVLMDIGLPGISGIEGVKYLKSKFPGILIVMCTVYEDSDEIFQAICSGAVGYLTKRTTPSNLIESLIEAYNGGSPMTPSVARKVISSFQNIRTEEKGKKDNCLSERELEILNLMAQGKSYNTIATEVYLSIDGVYYHIRHIYEKLQVHSRAEAVAEGLKQRIIKSV